MTGMLIVASLGFCIAGIVWTLRRRWHTQVSPASLAVISRKTLAFQAFAHGNRRLAAGRFDEARAAFHQVLNLDPKHPHVAGQLAAVEQQRHIARATSRGSTTVFSKTHHPGR